MALLFSEGFDGTGGSTIIGAGRKWTAGGGVAITASGRNGQGLQWTSQGGTGIRCVLPPYTGNELIAGCAIKPQLGSGQTHLAIGFHTTSAVNSNYEAALGITSGGFVQVATGPAGFGFGANLTTSADQQFSNSTDFKYIELRHVRDVTNGIIQARVNGVVVATSTGDTQVSGEAQALVLYLGGTGVTGATGVNGVVVDDIYVLSATGGGHTTYLGDTHIHTIRPNGNGNSSDFIGSDGNSTDNYLLVDESTVDDTDYVESTVDGDKDTYTFSNPTLVSDRVAAVAINVRSSRLSDADPKDLNLISRLSVTEQASPVALTTSFTNRFAIQETKPGGGDWTATDVNDAEFGYEQIDA